MFKNAKIFGKINIFDFIVLILVAFLVLGVLSFFGLRLLADEPLIENRLLKEVNYTVVLKSVRPETVNAFHPDMKIYDSNTKDCIGIITDLKTMEAKELTGTFDGRAVNATVEGKYDLTITLKALVSETKTGDLWISDRDRLLEGRTVSFVTQIASCHGNVTSISFTDDLGTLTGRFSDARNAYYERNGE